MTRKQTRFLWGYRGQRFLGLTTPHFNLVLLASLACLSPGWWFAGRVAGSFIARIGPLVLTIWKPMR